MRFAKSSRPGAGFRQAICCRSATTRSACESQVFLTANISDFSNSCVRIGLHLIALVKCFPSPIVSASIKPTKTRFALRMQWLLNIMSTHVVERYSSPCIIFAHIHCVWIVSLPLLQSHPADHITYVSWLMISKR